MVLTTQHLPAAADAAHLTEALRRSGMLGEDCVRDVVVESSRPTILSQIMRLRLVYDNDATEAPRSVILKTPHPDRVDTRWNAGRQEVAFYTDVAGSLPRCIVPRCFEAHCEPTTRSWHLLLEDLTDTHSLATMWPLPPTTEQCERIVAAWARFHATWWDDPRLGSSIGTWRDAAASDRMLRDLAAHFARFVDRLGDRLPRERRMLFERLLDAAPRLLQRDHTHRNVTLIHGDAHVWNIFLPRDGGDDLRLFDWDGWRIGIAAYDLAYMMALHWYRDRRHRLERALLDRYHATLLAHGVRGYDRQSLDDDYRWAALWQMATPVWQAAHDIPPVVWWNHMERIFLAVDDLGSRELLS
ncbi:MAG: phosphotransferase [Acetobacteraceae bacterium]